MSRTHPKRKHLHRHYTTVRMSIYLSVLEDPRERCSCGGSKAKQEFIDTHPCHRIETFAPCGMRWKSQIHITHAFVRAHQPHAPPCKDLDCRVLCAAVRDMSRICTEQGMRSFGSGKETKSPDQQRCQGITLYQNLQRTPTFRRNSHFAHDSITDG